MAAARTVRRSTCPACADVINGNAGPASHRSKQSPATRPQASACRDLPIRPRHHLVPAFSRENHDRRFSTSSAPMSTPTRRARTPRARPHSPTRRGGLRRRCINACPQHLGAAEPASRDATRSPRRRTRPRPLTQDPPRPGITTRATHRPYDKIRVPSVFGVAARRRVPSLGPGSASVVMSQPRRSARHEEHLGEPVPRRTGRT
jgi:hypothetical protein